MPRLPARAAVGVAVFLLGLLDVNALSLSVRSHTRLRDTTLLGTRNAITDALSRLRELIEPGGPSAFEAAAREAIGRGLAAQVSVFLPDGQRLFSFPSPLPLGHWPVAEEMGQVRSGRLLTLGPLSGEGYRVVTYAALPGGGETVILRLATEVPDLVSDLRERRHLFFGHAVALMVLVLAGALITAPGRSEVASPPAALRAYEEAMERLRDQGHEVALHYEAERRRWDDAIRDKEAMARAGELASGIAHEVRNGLGTIVGYARLLERESPAPGVLEAARGIREECETLETVVRRFVDFVKWEDLHGAPFDLRRMLLRVVARESRSRPGAEVVVEDGDFGEMEGDEELLERAFENLVRNAREAGSEVRIAVSRDARGALVSVADDGPGLPPGAVFRPFFTTKPGGLGLGLPLAKKIVQLHGGELRLEPRRPRGLVVEVSLPARPMPVEARAEPTPSPGSSVSS